MADSPTLPGSNRAPLPDEHRYRETLDSLREGFQIIGFDWKYVYVNPAAARHGRRSPEELVGLSMSDAYPGIDQTPLFEVLRRCMEERIPHSFENHFTYPDGRTHWFEIRVQPVPEGICVYSTDINDRKEAEAEQQRLRDEIEFQRLRVFKATMTTVHDIVNNFLQSLQLIRLEAEGRLSVETLTLFDAMIEETSSKLNVLGDLQTVNERQMAVGIGIEFPDA